MTHNAVPQLRSAGLDNGLVEITWNDSSRSVYHPIWLRDNCRCESCGDPAIGYRNLCLTALDLDIRPEALTTEPRQLTINWPDSHRSTFTAAWLHAHAYDETKRKERVF